MEPKTRMLTPEGFKSWPLQGWMPIQSMFLPQRRGIDLIGLDSKAAYETLWRTQPWIHAVVSKIARGIARLPWEVMDDEEISSIEDPNSDLDALLDSPFPHGSSFSLKEAVIGSLAMYANSLVIPDFGDAVPWTKPPSALWPIPWRYVYPIAGHDEPVGAFVIQIGSVRRVFLPDDVIHLQWWSPEGFLGVSPLEPLRTTLALEDAAQRYSINSFANGARPSGALQTDRPMNSPDRKKLKAEIEAQHGGIDNAFRVALLTHGLKWQPFSHTAVESELINLRKLTREEVCGVYDMPPAMVQINDHATGRTNLPELHQILYQDSYAPWMVCVEEGFKVQLLNRINRWSTKRLRFDLDEVLRGDENQRSISSQRRFQSAQLTPNELRDAEGYPPVLGSMDDNGQPIPDHPANQVYVPVNMLPASHVLQGIDLQQSNDNGEQPGAPGPGGEHQQTLAEIRSLVMKLERAGFSLNGHTQED